MNEEEFRAYLRKGRRSESVAEKCIRATQQFADYLQEQRGGRGLDEADTEDLEGFVAQVERAPKASAKGHLWALRYYFQFRGNKEMERLASCLRQERIETKPAALKDFPGVDPEHLAALAEAGIHDAGQMIASGRTPATRRALAEKTGVPLDRILELVKLSDLSRLKGVRGIRARLYLDAGIDTVAHMAEWDPEALRQEIVAFVERTGFEGVPTLPAEVRATVAEAQQLPDVAEY
ncbi:MAG: DUF4332 domain-containing protein [Anaerolineae bacterium]